MRFGALALIVATSCVAGLFGGCAKPPPPRPPPVVEEPPPPPPPPPKCDAIDEGCTATAETRSPIQETEWTIAPPEKWRYAHESDATIARTDDAIVAFTIHDTGDKKTESAKRGEALERLSQKMGLTMPKKKLVFPQKPAKLLTVGSVKVGLYQFDKVTKETKPGAFLVFTSKLPSGRSLTGAGFVLDTDTHDSDQAILGAVQSLRAEGGSTSADAGAPGK